MKWEDFKNNYIEQYNQNIKTTIECPKCGEYIYKDNRVVLASFPVQYRYFCKNCGWGGTTSACY